MKKYWIIMLSVVGGISLGMWLVVSTIADQRKADAQEVVTEQIKEVNTVTQKSPSTKPKEDTKSGGEIELTEDLYGTIIEKLDDYYAQQATATKKSNPTTKVGKYDAEIITTVPKHVKDYQEYHGYRGYDSNITMGMMKGERL